METVPPPAALWKSNCVSLTHITITVLQHRYVQLPWTSQHSARSQIVVNLHFDVIWPYLYCVPQYTKSGLICFSSFFTESASGSTPACFFRGYETCVSVMLKRGGLMYHVFAAGGGCCFGAASSQRISGSPDCQLLVSAGSCLSTAHEAIRTRGVMEGFAPVAWCIRVNQCQLATVVWFQILEPSFAHKHFFSN